MLSRLKLQEGWFTFFLLWAMILVAGLAVVQTEVIEGLEIVPAIGSVAVFAGLALAKSRFSDRVAHAFSLVYGLFFLVYFVGMILPGDLPWRERVFDIVERQFAWLRIAFGEGTGRDGLVFVIQTAAVFWLLGYTAAWYTFRHARVWRAVLPTGLVLLSVVYYYYGPRALSVNLALYALLSLLYVAQTHVVGRQKEWHLLSIRYDRGIRFTFLRASLTAGLLALMIAYWLPALSASAAVNDAISNVDAPWRRFQDTWTRLFASLRTYGGTVTDPYSEGLVLGGPRTVGDDLVMDIQVADKLPSVYWQATVFDTYRDSWRPAPGDQVIRYPEDGFFEVPLLQAREVITQSVTNYRASSGIIYGAGEIIGSDREMVVTRALDDEGRELIHAVRSRYVLRPSDTYQVVSAISTVDVSSLRRASQNYPAWVTDRYLQLPNTITEQTRELADELAAPYGNPYDQAIAVRDWLRRNIVYNDQIPAPPQNVEPVDFLLFVSRQGYCNYYASAMAVMLRHLGIPSRVLGGYAQGEWVEETSSYRVRATNAHTWVEAYFPGYGWIPFEPTASIPTVELPPGEDLASDDAGDAFNNPAEPVQPEDDRPLLDTEVLDPNDFGAAFEPGQDGVTGDEGTTAGNSGALLLRTGIALLIVGIAAGLVVVGTQLNAQVEGDINRSYSRLGNWSRYLGLKLRPAHTPYERANMLSTAVPEGQSAIRNLTEEFVRLTFGPRKEAPPEVNARQEWRVLRPMMLRRTLRHWWHRLRRQPELPEEPEERKSLSDLRRR